MTKNPLDDFESEQKILTHLKDLFEFVAPSILRRNLEDLLFLHLSSNEESALQNEKELIKNFYFLINFLNEVDDLRRF